MLTRLFISILLAMPVLLTACQTPRPYAAKPPSDTLGVERNHGYALLYQTIESETKVAQVLTIKRPRPEVADLLRDISAMARDAQDRLVAFAELDDALGYDDHGLPYIEGRTRDLITATTTSAILFNSRRTFEYFMLKSQHEALSYIMHLAQALRELDDDQARQAYLGELAEQAKELHERVVALLKRPYLDAHEE